MEHITANDEAAKDRLMKGLDGFLERDRDRALFDFSAPRLSPVPPYFTLRREAAMAARKLPQTAPDTAMGWYAVCRVRFNK